jgi:hypothetical protein
MKRIAILFLATLFAAVMLAACRAPEDQPGVEPAVTSIGSLTVIEDTKRGVTCYRTTYPVNGGASVALSCVYTAAPEDPQ